MSPLIRSLVNRALDPGRLLVAPGFVVRASHVERETIRWEIFLGHLLDAAATRNRESFESWHVYLDTIEKQADTPLISVAWHSASETAFVIRQILTHAFEAWEESPGVIGTRPTQKWVRELVGSVSCRGLNETEIETQLSQLVYLAVCGISRLPITSLESPLPCFSLGELGYFPVESTPNTPQASTFSRLSSLLQLPDAALASRALEFALRYLPPEDDERLIAALGQGGPERTRRLLRAVFNQAALAPHTGFTERLVGLAERLASETWFGPTRAVDLLSFMLRQLCRHLTAFDLSLFHNFGANYPDALFLDSLLKALLRILEHRPGLALDAGQGLVRRGIRMAVLLRATYEGLRVPDVPTSMGENARVLPAPFVRVPEDQITDQGRRRRVLFADDPTDRLFGPPTRRILAWCFQDLDAEPELRELGTAIFLDRPLGAMKQPGQVDRTPLVSYIAFSRLTAVRRLAIAKTAGWIDAARHDTLSARLATMAPTGIPAAELTCVERPGVVSLSDANKAAADFVILCSTRGSLAELISLYDWRPLADRFPHASDRLLAGAEAMFLQRRVSLADPAVRFEFFCAGELQFVLSPRTAQGRMAAYRERAGAELLTPLVLQCVRDESGQLIDVSAPEILIQAK